ncbi:aminotransferase class I/II-fold pyridoxal phosphate-dependent enzyme [Candidatus Woesearchaeota archaeon]|nr:aminotransferase class I/II-fold pyridoxal phosphate-dependent enzyme [Candidatus Woesearchaeota archaeon]
MHPQASRLNAILKKEAPVIFGLLSAKGRALFFPSQGIPAQAAEAKRKKLNATIGIGMYDDGTPMRLDAIASNILLDPNDVFPYAPSAGVKELREAWLADLLKKNPGMTVETSIPVVTAGITHAMSVAADLFIDSSDVIVTFDLFWENYEMIFCHHHGAALNKIPMFDGKGLNTQGFSDAIHAAGTKKGAGRTKGKNSKLIVLLNFPNNPTGYTPTMEEAIDLITALQQAAIKGRKVVVLLDDAYAGFVYRNGMAESFFSRLAGLHQNLLAVKIDGATKEEFAWGLRVGFLTFAAKGITPLACRALEDKATGAVRGSVSNVSHLSQSLVLRALQSPSLEQEKKKNYAILKKRYEAMMDAVHKEKYQEFFSPLPCNAAYFTCLRLKKGIDAEQVRQALLKKYSTGVVALGSTIRLSFSSIPEKLIPQLVENVHHACRDVKKD